MEYEKLLNILERIVLLFEETAEKILSTLK